MSKQRKLGARQCALALAGGWILMWVCRWIGWHDSAVFLARAVTAAAFVGGLFWLIGYVERQSREIDAARKSANLKRGAKHWNPLDLSAWYYRPTQRRLDQSLVTLLGYSLVFLVAVMLLSRMGGCREVYEMPAGGGEEKQQRQVVKVEKVVQKKFVINPFSSVIFNPPPIEEVQLQMLEVTAHEYEIGQGQGEGAGFSGGEQRGKVRFIRLEYEGGDWDQDFGIGADLNLLLEYGIRTGHQVHDRTESRQVAQLKSFPALQSPPMVYMTGQKNIHLSEDGIETLREYLLDKHGMLFADNGGSAHWHGQFVEMMQRVLPTIRPIRVPLDHPVHQTPYQIPFLPYVAPHGGKDALGWVVDGRLVCYYHPGDIGDAWADGHAGVQRQIWETCYQLGTNIIFYSHAQYNRWLEAQQDSDD